MTSKFSRLLPGVLCVVEGAGGTVAFVLQQKGPYAGCWLVPGGGLEFGEPAEAAFVRETLEETGLRVEPGSARLFAVYELHGTWSEGPYHFVLLAFHGRTSDTVPDGFEGHNVGGILLARPQEVPLHSTDLRILTDAGLAQFSEEEISTALERDGIRMVRYGLGRHDHLKRS